MSSFSKMTFRPVDEQDIEQLDKWRWCYLPADLEVVHGWRAPGVETVVSDKGEELIGSLTGKVAVVAVIDPFIHNPEAKGPDIYAAVVGMERILAYEGAAAGALEAYIAVPKQLTDYIEIVKRSGYEVTCQECVILRRPLVPETHRRLGPERDKVLADVQEAPPQTLTERASPVA